MWLYYASAIHFVELFWASFIFRNVSTSVLVLQSRFDKTMHVIKKWDHSNPPQRTVPLTNADAAQHSLLVSLVLPQELTNDVSTQTEAHNNELSVRVCPLNVANHGCKFPCASCKMKQYSAIIKTQKHTLFYSALLAEDFFNSGYQIWVSKIF